MKIIPIMSELEILQRRVEILEKGFQKIIALIKKDDIPEGVQMAKEQQKPPPPPPKRLIREGVEIVKPSNDCDDGCDDEDDTCDGCGRISDDYGQCPLCCASGEYAPGSEKCDFCEHSYTCSKRAASLIKKGK